LCLTLEVVRQHKVFELPAAHAVTLRAHPNDACIQHERKVLGADCHNSTDSSRARYHMVMFAEEKMPILVLDFFWVEELNLREADVIVAARTNVEKGYPFITIRPIGKARSFFEIYMVCEREQPLFRNLAQRRIDERHFFVAGIAEVDKPLPVKRT